MGLVRISEQQTWPCSAQIFDDLLGQLQQALTLERSALVGTVAAARDSQLHWWSIASLTAEEFQVVLRAVESVRQKRGDQGPRNLAELDAYALFMDRLDALVRALQTDQRAGPIRSRT